MGRERKGEGKPRRRKDGIWVQWLDLGYRDGQRIRKKVEGKDRNDVVHRVAELRRKHEAGIDITEKPKTLRDYTAYCLDDVLTLDHEARTIESYRDVLDRYVLPVLGKLAVDTITTPQIQKLITGLSRQKATEATDKRYRAKLKPKSLALIRTALRSIFNQAIVDKLRTDNPVDGVKIPKIGPSPGKALTPEQTRALLDALRGDPYELAIRLALVLGGRRGEIAGLRREDIDFDKETLTINGSLGYLRSRGLVYGPIKGDRPPRRFKLTADLIAAIRWHLSRLDAQRKAMADKWQDSPYLFVSLKSGGPLNPGRLWDHFKAAARAAGLGDYRLHDLRHSCASYLKAKGWDLKRISVHLGHANTNITNNLYIHLFSDALDSAAEDVESYIRGDAEDTDESRKQGRG
jgi:integrase